MADNKKYMARVPIIPDDFENKDEHKNHELVMDFIENDIYVLVMFLLQDKSKKKLKVFKMVL